MWAKYLSQAELSYNSSFRYAIEMTHLRQYMEGILHLCWSINKSQQANLELEENLIETDQILAVIRAHLHKAQQKTKLQTDGHKIWVSGGRHGLFRDETLHKDLIWWKTRWEKWLVDK